MFRCHFCQQITPPKTPKQYVVIATREKQYPTRRREAKRPRGRFRPREDAVQDHGGKGMEIAQEVAACPACAAKQHEMTTIPIESPPDPSVVESEATVESSAEIPAEATTEASPAGQTATEAVASSKSSE